MHYETHFEMCSMLFLIIVTVRFFSMRQFPDRRNRLFGVILICAIADLLLDIVGSYTIEFASVIPVWVNYVINTVFYSMQVIFPALMMTYVLVMCGKRDIPHAKYKWLYLPMILFELILLSSPATDAIFYVREIDGVVTYCHGWLFYALYIGSAFYMVTTLILLRKHRDDIKRDQYNVIISFIVIIVAAMIVQVLHPQFLLTGVAITAAVMMMFFTMQNPENMLDLISGVFNYEALNEFLRAQIEDGQAFQIIALDIGGIRRVNSSFGVQAGNEALGRVGSFLNRETGTNAWAFRMIGTRFIVITKREGDYERILHSMEARFREPWLALNMEIHLIATIRHFPEWHAFNSPQEVINLVDMAYIQAEDPGWGSSRACGIELLETAVRRQQIEEAVRRALDTGKGFYLNYQPMYSVAKERFVSAEALLRLEDPELGFIPPEEFISVAERTGLIFSIDLKVIDMVCDFLKRHPELEERGFEFMEINFSAAEFGRDVTELEEHICTQGNINPARLCFEVTETVAVRYEDVLNDFMTRMNAQGYRFALDDFGTGYANIMRVAKLPFSIVKMDRTMLTSSDEKERIIFADLLTLFSNLGLDTVVEGIEEAEQVERVTALGASFIQGFLFSQPLGEDEYVDFLKINM